MLYVCNENDGYNLTHGKVYDLTDDSPRPSGTPFLKGIDDDGHQFSAFARRFSPAPVAAPGLYLCVDNCNGGVHLTVGKVYQGVPLEHGDVMVTNDYGGECAYMAKRFVELKDGIAIDYRHSYNPPPVTHDQIAAVLNPIVSKLDPDGIARKRLARIALALAPVAGRDSFMLACGFVRSTAHD